MFKEIIESGQFVETYQEIYERERAHHGPEPVFWPVYIRDGQKVDGLMIHGESPKVFHSRNHRESS